jgi:hypothetical protein
MPIAGLAAIGIGAIPMLVVPGRPRYREVGAHRRSSLEPGRIYLASTMRATTCWCDGRRRDTGRGSALSSNDVFPIATASAGSRPTSTCRQTRRGDARPKEQLGLTIANIGRRLERQGSTPLRITATNEDGETVALFAKLYAKSHVRADRWYKLGRRCSTGASIRPVRPCGASSSTRTTRRLLGDYGFTTPKALGVEIARARVPDREEFFETP